MYGRRLGFSAQINVSTLAQSSGVRILGDEQFGLLGYSVSSAGDVNDDGLNDIVLGAPGVNSDTGQTYLIYGDDRLFVDGFE